MQKILNKIKRPTVLGLVRSMAIFIACLVSMVPVQKVTGQTCGNLLSVGPVISPISGSRVIIGQTITITRFTASSAAGNCLFRNGVAYYADPHNNVVQVMQDLALDPGQAADCLGSAGGICLPFTTTYVVNASDINRTLTIVLPPRGQYSGSTEIKPGQAGRIQFFGAGDVDGFDPNDPTAETGAGSGTASQFLEVVRPCITITKLCDQTCFPYGAPITFHGVVSNTGNTPLTQITVTDNPPATIVFAPNKTNGNPFNGSLNAGESVNYTGSYQPSGNLCGPFADTITATGVASQVAGTPTVSNTDPCYDANFQTTGPRPPVSATCTVCNNPGIEVTKNCGPASIALGGSYTVSGSVRNTGDIPLSNVVVVDHVTNPNGTVTINIGDLAVGETKPIPTQTITPTACGPSSDFFTVTAVSVCGGAVNDTSDTCTTQVSCPPCVKIWEEVVCYTPNDCEFTENPNDETSACGMKNEDGSSCSAFCYRIRVAAVCEDGSPSPVPLKDVVVTSSTLDLSNCNFPSTLAPGQVVECVIPGVTRCANTTDTATVNANSAVDNTPVSSSDSTTVTIIPVAVSCDLTLFSSFDLDNNPNDAHVTLPQSSDPQTVTVNIHINNNSGVTLKVDVETTPALNCEGGLTGLIVPDGGLNLTCTVDATCPGIPEISVTVVGEVYEPTTDCHCIYDKDGNPIKTKVSAPCTGSIVCEAPKSCRVTGGGQLTPNLSAPLCDREGGEILTIATTIYPQQDLIKKITHGGQLGAPYADQTCYNPGSDCIRGQWEHQRHYIGKGNIVDTISIDVQNAHSNTPKGIFDMVKCACLPCCTDEIIEDPVTGKLCNPDNRECGPEPRRAPANAIIFSGVAQYKYGNPGKGKASSDWYVFRVYVEDRSEPGGAHPKGQTSPSDVYCFQAWKLKPGEFDPANPKNDLSNGLRQAVAGDGCAFIVNHANGALPPSSAAGRAADINDIGPLDRGNHQIHPSTSAECQQ